MKRPVLSAFSGAFLLGAAMVLPGEAAEVTIEAVNKAVAAIEKKAEAEIAENAVAGMAIGVVFHDKLIYAKGFGVRDTATGEPIDPDTVFQIASLSKSVGSTVVAALVGEGKITWDSRISDLDPGFEMYSPFVTRELTIRDLYAHRSGLPDHAGDLLEDLGFARAEILHRLRYQPPSSSFRAGYAYTNFGLTEGGIAAAKAYGLDWEAASEEKLYKPLGMTSTSSRYADFLARPNRALGHVLVDGKWVAKYQRDPDTESPAGGVSSSINDLAKWVRLQLGNGKFEGKQVVAEAPLAETHLPQIMTSASTASGIPGFYGLGWNVGYSKEATLRLSHSGAFSYGTGNERQHVAERSARDHHPHQQRADRRRGSDRRRVPRPRDHRHLEPRLADALQERVRGADVGGHREEPGDIRDATRSATAAGRKRRLCRHLHERLLRRHHRRGEGRRP